MNWRIKAAKDWLFCIRLPTNSVYRWADGWKMSSFLLVVMFTFLGCEVYSDRWVSGSRSRTSELHGPGWLAERHRVHLSCWPVEPRHHFIGNVLRRETETHHQVSGMEGNQRQCFAQGPLSQFQTPRLTVILGEDSALRPPSPTSCTVTPDSCCSSHSCRYCSALCSLCLGSGLAWSQSGTTAISWRSKRDFFCLVN